MSGDPGQEVTWDFPLVRESQRAFTEFSGRVPTHGVYAPGRVNLIGEHTDYNDGFVLPFAINMGICVVARGRSDRIARIWSTEKGFDSVSLDLGSRIEPGPPAWGNYIRGVVSGLRDAGINLPGLDAVVHANLPPGGGLSSSAALLVAMATLGEGLSGQQLDPEAKALLCQKAEHDFAGMPSGIMDQFAGTFCRPNQLLLIDCQSRKRQLIPIPGSDIAFLVINSMVKHELSDGRYRMRREECDEAARLMGISSLRNASLELLHKHRTDLTDTLFRRARHVLSENDRTLLVVEAVQNAQWQRVGELMYESHQSLREDFEVSCGELDAIVEIARDIGREGGLYGCRMTGGGFGGCCIALARKANAEEVSRHINAHYQEATGRVPTVFATEPCGGVQVLLGSPADAPGG